MARKLYVAYDLDGGDLIGAIWAESRLKALDYFFSRPPLMPDQQDRLYLEPIEESDWTIQELAEIDPEIAENDNYGFICDAYDSDIDIDRLTGRFNESRKSKHFSDALFTDLELPSTLTSKHISK